MIRERQDKFWRKEDVQADLDRLTVQKAAIEKKIVETEATLAEM